MENLIEALTSKNREYIHSVTKQLMLVGKNDEEIKEILSDILPQIIDGQKTGTLARKLLGSPTDFVDQYQPKTATQAVSEKNETPVLMWLDSTLLFLGFIALFNGIMNFFSSTTPIYGVVTIVLSAAAAGLAMYLMYRFFYRPKADGSSKKWNLKGFAATSLAFLLWVVVTMGTGMLPATINLQLPALVLVALGLVTLAVRWLLKRQFNIQSAFVSQARK